ncbi:putative sporulation protein YtaF [Seinonella peptonophila]|uniref:Putative sporulation protein YtaF n=1 Tax=Seinonella peptonophila TaxID=112248 RepID=A0A1M4W338_9BACL|nr:sporulation membrane protein YtaF [Seinonella peptonophila]SHE75714.1 putative sporulation protein YtaF [Seinonella peptonophila]
MMHSLLLAIAVSLDSLSAGCSYGMRNIRIPFLSKLIIAFCSGCVIFLAMSIGNQLKQLFPIVMMQVIGMVILISLGCIAIYQGICNTGDQENTEKEETWNPFTILRKPTIADVDRSGSISSWEAILLGFALALDAFGVGLGAAMLDFPVLWLSFCITITAGLFLHLGMILGFRLMTQGRWGRYLSCIPGVLLILLGLSRLW